MAGLIQTYLFAERPESDCDTLFLVAMGPNRGKPLTPAGLHTIFRHHRAKVGVPAGHPHALRHTFGTALAEAGVDHRRVHAGCDSSGAGFCAPWPRWGFSRCCGRLWRPASGSSRNRETRGGWRTCRPQTPPSAARGNLGGTDAPLRVRMSLSPANGRSITLAGSNSKSVSTSYVVARKSDQLPSRSKER